MPDSLTDRLCHLLSRIAVGVVLLWSTPAGAQPADVISADLVVYGGTSAGVVAAVQARRMGHSAVLLEPGRHLGGLTSGGLGFTDSGDKRVIGGLSREFYEAVKSHYDQPKAWFLEDPGDYSRYRSGDTAMWTFEPRVAEAIFRQMLREADVDVRLGERLNRESGVQVRAGRIVSIAMESGLTLQGSMFIDATYEGDLMAAAGVPWTVGRESNAQYSETLNGNQVRANTHNHRFLKDVDPWIEPGNPDSGLLPFIESGGPGREGEGDDRIQAYCFRMCMSNDPRNRVPFPKPAGYDEQQYELLFRNFEAGDLRLPFKADMMPNHKTDTNNNCAVSTDFIGANYDYPEASWDEREAIIRAHETWQKGLMWSLANHSRVPQSIRDQMQEWGLAADEFTDNGNWPHQLYIREARRMVSDYVVTEHDCRRERLCDDAVGLGSYNMDSHNVRRFVTDRGFVQNEGDVQVSPGGAYLISFRAIVPPRDSVTNLCVPVCLSASHIAYGSIRMEPVFMVLGHSAATAAVLALRDQSAVQDVSYEQLRPLLLRQGQVLDLPPGAQPRSVIRADSLAGAVSDEGAAELTGGWIRSTSTPKFVGAAYLHDGDDSKGMMQATFRLRAATRGSHQIRVSYSAHANRATNVPVTVRTGAFILESRVNQRESPPIDGLFRQVATVDLHPGDTVEVVIGNAATDGHVIVDAVQLLPIDETQ